MHKNLLILSFLSFIIFSCSNDNTQTSEKNLQHPPITDFSEKIGIAPIEGGFKMDDYWVWGGSCIKGEDGKFHLFASRWPKKYPFMEGYVFYSEVVHATSDKPEGPYAFQEVVLNQRGEEFWDGRMTHNPTIKKSGDTYYLFYIGSTFNGEAPDLDSLHHIKKVYKTIPYKNIRIGVAKSTSLNGPWQRMDQPILSPQKGGFDSVVVTNPAPVIGENGETYMVYRTFMRGVGHRLGVAKANQPDGKYERVIQGPIAAAQVEDPYIWKIDTTFYIIAKDMTGDITGEKHAGVFLTTSDLTQWELGENPKAYSRHVHWSNGDTTIQGSFERPQILIQNGKPTHLFAATADGPGGFREAENTWNMVIPLKD